ncbi:MAG TPA: GTP cyclohydrolase [Chloroflexota bacterium]|nr:GTP cyclohydrolase [Chloroflexota bacterium]
MIIRLAERILHTKFGVFNEILYYDGQKESIAIVMGDILNGTEVLCRVHSSCLSAHIFNSIECDCREQMEISQALIKEEGRGIVIWLDQEGRGNGHLALINADKTAKINGITQTQAYKLHGFLEDARNFTRAAEILQDLGVTSIVVLTNNPTKAEDLKATGINVVGIKQVVIDVDKSDILKKYYKDKIEQGHDIEL